MPPWTPEETWKGGDVFIIGGGPSLRGFDWSLLHDEYTIGCNTAFTLGEKVCKICVFGDFSWWQAYRHELASYKGIVFTNNEKIREKIDWLWTMKRQPLGLHKDALGWNDNTGAVAINLALLLGAQRVFLLGFDMRRMEDRPNWHDRIINPSATQPHVYQRFIQCFRFVVRDWKAKFPDREILNVTNDSGLGPEVFPWVNPDHFWADRRAMRREDLRVRQMAIDDDNEHRAVDEVFISTPPDVPLVGDRRL